MKNRNIYEIVNGENTKSTVLYTKDIIPEIDLVTMNKEYRRKNKSGYYVKSYPEPVLLFDVDGLNDFIRLPGEENVKRFLEDVLLRKYINGMAIKSGIEPDSIDLNSDKAKKLRGPILNSFIVDSFDVIYGVDRPNDNKQIRLSRRFPSHVKKPNDYELIDKLVPERSREDVYKKVEETIDNWLEVIEKNEEKIRDKHGRVVTDEDEKRELLRNHVKIYGRVVRDKVTDVLDVIKYPSDTALEDRLKALDVVSRWMEESADYLKLEYQDRGGIKTIPYSYDNSSGGSYTYDFIFAYDDDKFEKVLDELESEELISRDCRRVKTSANEEIEICSELSLEDKDKYMEVVGNIEIEGEKHQIIKKGFPKSPKFESEMVDVVKTSRSWIDGLFDNVVVDTRVKITGEKLSDKIELFSSRLKEWCEEKGIPRSERNKIDSIFKVRAQELCTKGKLKYRDSCVDVAFLMAGKELDKDDFVGLVEELL